MLNLLIWIFCKDCKCIGLSERKGEPNTCNCKQFWWHPTMYCFGILRAYSVNFKPETHWRFVKHLFSANQSGKLFKQGYYHSLLSKLSQYQIILILGWASSPQWFSSRVLIFASCIRAPYTNILFLSEWDKYKHIHTIVSLSMITLK